ncbi:hypothetical protein [Oceanihabitans sediminis]|uniref:hypothetical protein n=1 Tax=Oceanihabitans sediminis TaxID=1812012 RepID=UPI003A90D208
MNKLLVLFHKIKKHGIVSIMSLAFRRAFNTYIAKFHYLKMDINYPSIKNEIEDITNDINIKELSYEDFLLGDKSVFIGDKLKSIKKRCLDPSYKAYGIIENNTLIYSTWISLDKLGLPVKSNYNLLPEEGLLEDSYCHPSRRGQGLHSKMNAYRLGKLYELGKTKCLAIVLDGNIYAYKVQMKSGFKDLGCFYAGLFFGIPFCTLKKQKFDI